MPVNPVISRAMRGEQISAAEIKALGGYDKFSEMLAEAMKAAKKPKKTSGLRVKTFEEYAAEDHPCSSYVKPDPREQKQHLPGTYYYGAVFFCICVLPFLVVVSCGN